MIFRCNETGCGKRIEQGAKRCKSHAYSSYRKNKRKQYGHKWSQLSRRFLKAYPLCALCYSKGKLTPSTISDHIEPLTDNSTNDQVLDLDNLAPLCHACHDWKTRNIDGIGGVKSEPEARNKFTRLVEKYKQDKGEL